MDKVVIVVLNYNGTKCLFDTLRSLQVLSYQNKEILVVDNASQDDSFGRAQELFPEYSYLALDHNGGFAYGMNRGIEYALNNKAQYVWLFNYDALAQKNALEPLVEEAQRYSDRVLLSPLILNERKEIWFSGGRINFWRMRAEHTLPKQLPRTHPTEFLTGCALFMPIKVIQEVGLLDERFFLYYEDVDYSVRARKFDVPRLIVPASEVIHSEESQFNSGKVYHLVLSGLLFFDKHKNIKFSLYQAIYGILRRLKNRIDIVLKRPGSQKVAQAYRDFYARKKANHFSHLR